MNYLTQMGRLRINLTQPTADVPVNNQHNLNGFIHESFGKNNPYHNTFSDYSISSLQGGKLNSDKKTLNFMREKLSLNETVYWFAVYVTLNPCFDTDFICWIDARHRSSMISP